MARWSPRSTERPSSRAIDAMVEAGRETVAVCLLHAYANPEHERRIRDEIAARAPGSAGVDFLGNLPEVSRVRTHEHDGHERLRQAHRRSLLAPSGRGSQGAGHPQRAVRDAIEWGADLTRPRAGLSGTHHRIRAGRGDPHVRHRRQAGGPRADHHIRHGRHHRKARCHRRRRSCRHADVRGRSRPLQEGQRIADQCASRRDDRDWRRWREHRAGKQRDDCRRPRQRRRRPWAHLLWPWRPRANHHRCQCGAGIHFPRLVQWRHHAARQGGSRPRHQARDCRSARSIHGGSGLGYPSRRDIQHGERAAHRLGRAGARSAFLRHGGFWRRRAASRRTARSRGRHTDGHCALWRRGWLGHRTASSGTTHRRHAHQGHAPRCDAIRPRDCRRVLGARSSGATGRENGSRRRASRNGPATRRCDMPGKGSRSMSICRRDR